MEREAEPRSQFVVLMFLGVLMLFVMHVQPFHFRVKPSPYCCTTQFAGEGLVQGYIPFLGLSEHGNACGHIVFSWQKQRVAHTDGYAIIVQVVPFRVGHMEYTGLHAAYNLSAKPSDSQSNPPTPTSRLRPPPLAGLLVKAESMENRNRLFCGGHGHPKG